MARKILFTILAFATVLATSMERSYTSEDLEIAGPELVLAENIPSDINVGFIEDFEGCLDTLTWPGAYSGPTIGCGIDLGNIGRRNIDAIFSDVVTAGELKILKSAAGVRGSSSKFWLKRNRVKLTPQQIHSTTRRMMRIMWKDVASRFHGIEESPGEVKTAVLSCAMNRGPYNPALNVLKAPLREKNYALVADLIADMSNAHSMRGLKKRRNIEATLARLAVNDDATYD